MKCPDCNRDMTDTYSADMAVISGQIDTHAYYCGYCKESWRECRDFDGLYLPSKHPVNEDSID